MAAKVSIIIPSRNETHMVSERDTVLQRMIRDIYRKCTGDFEVIVAFDGSPYQELPDYPDLKILKMPDVNERFSSNGAESVGSSPEQFGEFIRSAIDKWAKVVKISGARID